MMMMQQIIDTLLFDMWPLQRTTLWELNAVS